MKYYAEHEHAYQELIKNGYIGWGKKTSVTELLSFPYKDELDRVLASFPPALDILDLGCGSGPVTLHLAKNGYRASGIDISSTAIAKATELARGLNITADFFCGDVLKENVFLKSFDVLVDSSFLHCIVFESDRTEVLKRIYSLLKPGGIFILHTMVSDREFNFGLSFEFDNDGILWYLSENSRATEARKHLRGVATPQRRILSSQRIKDDLRSFGLEEVESKILYFEEDGPLSLFGAFLKTNSPPSLSVLSESERNEAVRKHDG